ncbi:hypothetical protein TNCV_5122871 [Trichonephila clavipes]|nr:hypothetical protein TNCV_5122871 [Trichonephila clavipes]
MAPTFPYCNLIVRVQYFVRGGFVGYRSRASSKHLSPSSSGRRARFLGGQKGGCVALASCTCGCRVYKETDQMLMFGEATLHSIPNVVGSNPA